MHRATFWLATVVAVGSAVASASATIATFDSNDWERRLQADVEDGRLDDFSLLQAALVAGGVADAAELEQAERRFQELLVDLRDATPAAATPHDGDVWQVTQARKMHQFLHQRVLRGEYRTDANQLQATLVDGHYNCVTAAVLYRCLADEFQLPVRLVATSTHVYCRLDGRSPRRIELTTPDSRAAVRPPSLERTQVDGALGAAEVAESELTPAQAIGKIYYNRAVEALRDRRFAPAVHWLRISRLCDPADSITRRNLLAAINNWALERCDARQYEQANQLLTWGRQIASDYSPFAVNDLHLHQQWALHLCRVERFDAALDVLEQGRRRRPEEPLFDGGRLAVWCAWIDSLTRNERRSEAQEVLDAALRQFPDASRLLRMQVELRGDLTGLGS